MKLNTLPSNHLWRRIFIALVVSALATGNLWAMYQSHLVDSVSANYGAHISMGMYFYLNQPSDGDHFMLFVGWGLLFAFALWKTTCGRDVLIKLRGMSAVIAIVAAIESLHDDASVWGIFLFWGLITAAGFYLASRGPKALHLSGGDRTTDPVYPTTRLFRARRRRVLAGICGGLSNRYAINVFAIRLVVAALFAALHFLIIGYVIAAIVIPEEPVGDHNHEQPIDAEFVDVITAV
jgi:phage shock protein C